MKGAGNARRREDSGAGNACRVEDSGGAAVHSPAGAAVRATVAAYEAGKVERRPDLLAAEEPLEMRVSLEEGGRRASHSVAVTMRTPGHDFELAAGFFLSEGILARREAIWS